MGKTVQRLPSLNQEQHQGKRISQINVIRKKTKEFLFYFLVFRLFKAFDNLFDSIK